MEKMKTKKNPKGRLILFVLIAALSFGMGILAAGNRLEKRDSKITSDLIQNRIEEISQLASLEYHYTRVGKYENRIDFYGWQVPMTMKRFIISYDGTIWAGVDLSRAKIKLKDDGSVEVSLPKAQILAHEQDLDSIQIFDETKNMFNPIQITDYIEFSKEQKQGAQEEAVAKGLLTKAQKRAQDVVTQWLTDLLNSTGASPQIQVSFTD